MKKFYLDLGMLAILLATMSFHILPKVLHEVLGLIMLVALIVHIRWNFHALRSSSKIFLSIDGIMIVGILVTVITGICISHHLFNGLIDMKIQRNITIHQLHVSLPFALMILIGLHLGRNWTSFRQRLSTLIPINPTVEKIVAIALCIVGVVGANMNQLVDRLMMKHIFATPAAQLPAALFVLLLLGMLAMSTAAGFVIARALKRW